VVKKKQRTSHHFHKHSSSKPWISFWGMIYCSSFGDVFLWCFGEKTQNIGSARAEKVMGLNYEAKRKIVQKTFRNKSCRLLSRVGTFGWLRKISEKKSCSFGQKKQNLCWSNSRGFVWSVVEIRKISKNSLTEEDGDWNLTKKQQQKL